VGKSEHGAGSTDMADVQHVVPSIHPYVMGAKGIGHSEDYQVTDPEVSYVTSTQLLAMTIIDLLWDEGKLLKEIKANYTPTYTKDEYLAFWRDFVGAK